MIILSGTVGAGKSTLAQVLNDRFDFNVIFEGNGEKELDIQTRELLTRYYENPTKYALEKNLYFLDKRVAAYISAVQSEKTTIMDRGLYDDYLMAKLNKLSGQMSESDWKTYRQAFEKAQSQIKGLQQPNNTDLLIYVTAPFNTVLHHVENRGREEEKIHKHPELALYYLDMYDLYEKFYKNWNRSPKIAIDTNKFDIHNDNEKRQDLLAYIGQKLIRENIL